MLDQLLSDCRTAWIKAKTQKKHPFRYFTLATTLDGNPQARVVVLRHYDLKTDCFTIYSDARTPKIVALKENPRATLLFYDPRKFLQVRVQAQCEAIKKDEEKFRQQHLAAQKDYTTSIAPGSPIKAMDAITYSEAHHFVVLQFKATTIDYLRLMRPNHQRALFAYKDGIWQGQFVAP